VPAALTTEPAKPATLQTTPPEKEQALADEIRAKLDRANKDLARVDYGRLSPEAQQQYDQAKSFATRTEEALRDKKLVFARELADRAAIIAAQLAGR
jgi:hypothetical protein